MASCEHPIHLQGALLAKEELIEMHGKVEEVLPDSRYRVTLDNGHSLVAYTSAAAHRCVAQAMPAVAITDTGNLFGALEFSAAAAEAGIQPVIGCQIGIRRTDASGGLDRR